MQAVWRWPVTMAMLVGLVWALSPPEPLPTSAVLYFSQLARARVVGGSGFRCLAEWEQRGRVHF